MTLRVERYEVGPLATNAYLLADTETGDAVVVDPGAAGEALAQEAARQGWQVRAVWITHAHFDHFAGWPALLKALPQRVPVALHPHDLPLWRAGGGASFFGFPLPQVPEPDLLLTHGQHLQVGRFVFQVRHAPGHSPGHVMFYAPQAGLVLCGDVIFREGIGRTDLPLGSFPLLIDSIRTQVFTLPDDARLLPGHGPETTVGYEKRFNPFVGQG